MLINSRIKINSSKDLIINLIKSKNNLEKFHPFCLKNEVINWDKKNSIDFVYYFSGKKYKRKFIKWNHDGYELEIYEDKKLAKISWSVLVNGHQSIVSIQAEPYLPYKSRFINIIIFHIYLKYMLTSYLNAVLNGLKFYIENNIIVKEDQYGKHRWYSA
jgi:hypothetical protein